MVFHSDTSSSSGLGTQNLQEQDITASSKSPNPRDSKMNSENEFQENAETVSSRTKTPFTQTLKKHFSPAGKLRPFRLLKQDVRNIKSRYLSDWTTFNQLVFASAVYVFFTNILPGITFASDLYVLTGMAWGTIEVVFSTGLCGIIFAL